MPVHPVHPSGPPTDRLVGTSPAITVLRAQIQQLVRFDSLGNPAVPTLLLQGETGTGKSLVARVVHDSGPRAAGPWLELNCATLPETMLEAELFGFEAGAFTDAKRAKPGLFEAASGGTLFLDEIDAVPLALQGKLLTALESKRVRRLGAVTERVVDVKIIAATNAELHACVSTGRMRTDLYHRLAVVILTLPPVRARGEDVVLLAQTFLQQLGTAHGVTPKRLEPDAEVWLQQYAWPGNVRELQHVLERVTLLQAGDSVTAAILVQWCQPLQAAPSAPMEVLPEPGASTQEQSQPQEPSLPAEALHIQQALVQAGGNVVQAARELGLSRDQLRTRMRRYGLTRQRLFALPTVGGPTPASPLVPEAARPAAQDARPLATPTQAESSAPPGPASPGPPSVTPSEAHPAPGDSRTTLGERRQLTVMFCELVDAAALASLCDPEEWQEVLQAYYTQCAEVTARYGGSLAQYLDAGLLLYFGYPQAHEDAALRAVRAGLELVEAIAHLHLPGGLEPLRTRIGIHTGPVVISPVAVGTHQDALALGETPHLAARLQRMAPPGTVVCSAATARLVTGYVTLETLGQHALPDVPTALPVYRVVDETGVHSRLELPSIRGLTPFVGRETEIALLRERWVQAQDGRGQVVVVCGDAGIGKSRLARLVQEEVVGPAALHAVYQGVATQQHSPFAPVIAHLHRVCGWRTDDLPEARLHQLEQVLESSALPLPEVVPLLAALVSLHLPPRYPPLSLSPQQQKQRTIDILIRWLLHETARQPVLLVVEDLHWIDPSTLEWLNAVIDQVPAAALYVLGTYRPEFIDPWLSRTYCTQITLTRLAPLHVAAMVTGITGGKRLPPAVVHQVARQTDGVPLFVEELTKMVLESALLEEQADHYVLQQPLPTLAIPTTLQDSLLARLDRLGTAKTVAQVGALIGREFPYTLLRAITPQDEPALQQDLARLVHAELLYQAGVPPQVTYRFKHALIQDAASQSLLKRTRQQYHRQIAEVLTAHFPETAATQPEVLAQHYTAAGCHEQAVVYWERAGQHASDRSAHLEAISHLTTGIELLTTLPETLEHTQHAVTLYIALGAALQVTKGHTAPEVEHAYAQAYALCQQVGETPELSTVLFGLWRFYMGRSQFHTARELGETLLHLAQQAHDPALAGVAHYALGGTWFYLGALPESRQHLEEGIARYMPDQRRAPVFRMGVDLGVASRAFAAMTLWMLGYPEQALAHVHDALALAHELSHPFSLAFARCWAAFVSQFRRDVPVVHEHAEAAVALSTEQGFPLWAAYGTSMRGWALAMQGQGEAGMAEVRQGIAACRATGAAMNLPYVCTLLAEVCDHLGHPEAGLQALAEAQTLMEQHEERWWEADIWRLRGVLLLRQTGTPQGEVETWLRQALDVARRQQAKALELRAAMSLARLWQHQGKRAEARQLLGELYGWFTEGFDTADLQEAQRLLTTLA